MIDPPKFTFKKIKCNHCSFQVFRCLECVFAAFQQCKASAEKKRVSWAVRQEKGNLLEGKERVTGP